MGLYADAVFAILKENRTVKEETVPCKWCGEPTRMLGTKECDNCHELRIRCQVNPHVADKIVKAILSGAVEKDK